MILYHVTWTESGLEQSSGVFSSLRSAIGFRRALIEFKGAAAVSPRVSLFSV